MPSLSYDFIKFIVHPLHGQTQTQVTVLALLTQAPQNHLARAKPMPCGLALVIHRICG